MTGLRTPLEREELEFLYRMDELCDRSTELEELVGVALGELCSRLGLRGAACVLREPASGEPVVRGVVGEVGLGEKELLKAAGRCGRRRRLFRLGGLWVQPVVMGRRSLGALLLRGRLGRSGRRLLAALESQLDNALAAALTLRDLRLRNLELETIYRIDRIRDTSETLDEMLERILVEMVEVLGAEMGAIFLYNEHLRELELKTLDETGRGALGEEALAALRSAAEEAIDATRALVVPAADCPPLREILCEPLFLNRSLIGVFCVINKQEGGSFDAEDRRLLHAIVSQSDTAIFENVRRALIKRIFKRYLSPEVVEQLLKDPYRPYLEGEKRRATLLFADIRGYSSATDGMDPRDVVGFLNRFLSGMAEIVLAERGTLDKFIGDEVVAIFGAPYAYRTHALSAARAALAMQERMVELNRESAAAGFPALQIGIGINTGEVVVGNIGGETYQDYTAVGAEMNLASRLCDQAPGGEIWISEATRRALGRRARLEPLGEILVKGRREPVAVYRLLGLRERRAGPAPGRGTATARHKATKQERRSP